MPTNAPNTNAPRESATIVQFPVGGRAGLVNGLANGLAAKRPGFAGSDRFAEVPMVANIGSWYHDDAISEAADTRKN